MTIRVEDVYRYDNTQENKKIYHLRVLIKALLEELTRLKGEIDGHGISGLNIQLDTAIL